MHRARYMDEEKNIMLIKLINCICMLQHFFNDSIFT